jgi:hypothetical protein
MDTARDKHTCELVEAEDLWIMAAVDPNGYLCRGCATQVFPASYDKARNKKRPYFTLGPVNKHQAGCDVTGEEKIVKRARKERVGSPEGFPVAFPNRLTLIDEREVAPPGPEGTGDKTGVRSGSRAPAGSTSKRHHGHTVTTIRTICRTYINFPYDRRTLPLAIPGVPGNTYADVFRYLGSKKPEHFDTPAQLYFGAIRWTVAPVETEAACELTLNAGEWIEKEKRFKRLSRVRVDWSGWSPSRRNALLREFDVTREEAATQAKTQSQVKGWLFFVGNQDADDAGLFHVSEFRLLCCLAATMNWPSSK